MKIVAILEGDSIQSLTTAKTLKEKGYKTILFFESRLSYGYHTRYADVKIKTPSISKNEASFHHFFINYIRENKVDAVIPMFDYSAKYLSKYKNILSKHTKFIIPDYDIFMRGYDKSKFMYFCKQNDFPHPNTFFNLSSHNIFDIEKEIGFPAIIKPNITNGARGLKVVRNTNDIKNSLPEIISKYGSCHIQEYIPQGGKQFLVGIYTNNNQLINATVIDKIRYYPIKGGSSCFSQSIKKDDLIKLCFKIQKELNWDGYAHYDLIEDPRDGSIKVMELNPRIQGCIKSSNISGVDFIDNIISDSFGLPLIKYTFIPGYSLRYLGLDILWFIKSKNKFNTKPKWIKGFFDPKHHLQDGSRDDIKPLIFGTIGNFIKQFDPQFRAKKKGMN